MHRDFLVKLNVRRCASARRISRTVLFAATAPYIFFRWYACPYDLRLREPSGQLRAAVIPAALTADKLYPSHSFPLVSANPRDY